MPLLCNLMYEKYDQLKTDTNVQVGLEADNHLFLKASGGWSGKQIIYGWDRDGTSMLQRPSRSRSSCSSTLSAWTLLLVTKL